MTLTDAGYVNAEEIESAVRKVEKDFSSRLAHIGYSYGEDHWGSPAISFRVLVPDEVSSMPELKSLSYDLSLALINEARIFENGLRPYTNFRTIAEQQELQDPAWA